MKRKLACDWLFFLMEIASLFSLLLGGIGRMDKNHPLMTLVK